MNILAVFVCKAFKEVFCQLLNVRPAPSEGYHGEVYDIETVVQVCPEAAVGNTFREVLIGGCNYSYIYIYGLCCAYAGYAVFLQRTQQNALHFNGHLAYLIQKQRAAVGKLKLALCTGAVCAGERSADIAEKLAAYKITGYRRTVYGDKGLILALAGAMDRICKKLLSGARFALNKYGA